jgi:hypothetical protein
MPLMLRKMKVKFLAVLVLLFSMDMVSGAVAFEAAPQSYDDILFIKLINFS